MTLHNTIFSLFLAFVSTSFCQNLPDFKTISVLDGAGTERKINLPSEKHFVILTLGTDCPISQKYVPTIEKLKRDLGTKTEFIGIFPKQTSVEEMNSFIAEYKLSVASYIDHKGEVISSLKATVTPEAFLFDQNQTKLYSGAIDNWFYKLGSYRSHPTKHYLENAIHSSLKGTVIETPHTEAIGCLLSKHVSSHEHH